MRGAGGAQRVARGALVARQIASSTCSVETYSSLRSRISRSAARSTDISSADVVGSASLLSVGSAASALLTSARSALGRGAELAQHGHDETLLLLEQDGQQVFGGDLSVAPARSEGEGCLQGLLGLDGEAVGVHGSECSSLRFLAASALHRRDQRRRRAASSQAVASAGAAHTSRLRSAESRVMRSVHSAVRIMVSCLVRARGVARPGAQSATTTSTIAPPPAGQAGVACDQRRIERLGERDVEAVVDGAYIAQLPAASQATERRDSDEGSGARAPDRATSAVALLDLRAAQEAPQRLGTSTSTSAGAWASSSIAPCSASVASPRRYATATDASTTQVTAAGRCRGLRGSPSC